MEENKKRVIYPLCIIVGIILSPFLVLIFTDRVQYLDADVGSIFSTVLTSFAGTSVKAMPSFLILFLVTFVTITASIALLFDIKIQKKKDDIQKSRFWKFVQRFLVIEKRHWWHVMLGYFLIMAMLAPQIGEEVVAVQKGLQIITNFQADFLTTVFLVPVLIIARILSKLDIEVMQTNIGSFIILVYVSEIIYLVFSGSEIPFEYLYGLITKSTSEVQGFVMLYGSIVVGTFVCTFTDYIIMWKWKKLL